MKNNNCNPKDIKKGDQKELLYRYIPKDMIIDIKMVIPKDKDNTIISGLDMNFLNMYILYNLFHVYFNLIYPLIRDYNQVHIYQP
jgi:hypothetical protein